MAIVYPSPLWRRTSRVYQDHPTRGVLTSFVPSVHNQGASVAPFQGHALWKIFLPATGSFFVVCCSLTARHAHQHLSVDVFLMFIRFCQSLTGSSHPDRDRNQIPECRMPDSSREQAVTSLCCYYATTGLLMSHIIFCPS